MPIVGTAGHVDHGKSTLVLALTGRDPDRWEEEKRRGLTIDLGFAWTRLPLPGGRGEEVVVGFVDVPGHERFIRNMLAGIEAIDVALFVVAADEGWMPQSEEHLAVLDLLGVRHGVVALSKADRVSPDLLELAQAEAEERLDGSSLAEAPLIPVSAPRGEGVEEIRKELAAAVAGAPAPADLGRPRLWIDRSFTIAGAGTVVTGTLVGGTLRVGDEVELWPAGQGGPPLQARVRNLQSYEEDRPEAGPGNRVAVNLAGLEREEVPRGSMLGRPGHWLASDRLLLDVRATRYLEEPLTDRGAYHLHVGSGAWPARLRFVEPWKEGRAAALAALFEPLPLAAGDRFILREVGRRLVVGGGEVLDPSPARRTAEVRRSLGPLREARDGGPDDRAVALLHVRGREARSRLRAHSGGGRAVDALEAGDTLLAPEAGEDLLRRAGRLVEDYHREHPLRPGAPAASLASRLGIEQEVLRALLERSPELREEQAVVKRADHRSTLQPAQEEAWAEARRTLLESGLTVPRAEELGLEPELFHLLVREGRLVKVSEELAYLPEQLDGLLERLARLSEPFSVAQFRDHLDITRKYAVPLLEWLDREGVTLREGDLRRFRRREPSRPAPDDAPSR